LVSAEDLEWHLDECLQLKQKYPDVIAGFDLVGAEDTGTPLTDYLVPFIAFRERVKDLGIDLPFIFHAGETLDDGGQTDGNLYDAILLGTKRIGHGCVTNERCTGRRRRWFRLIDRVAFSQVLASQAPRAYESLPRGGHLSRVLSDQQ
jgi:adenosine deaminase